MHKVGNLKNIPYADMITIRVPPQDLRPMLKVQRYTVAQLGHPAKRYTEKAASRKRARDQPEEEVSSSFVVVRYVLASKAKL